MYGIVTTAEKSGPGRVRVVVEIRTNSNTPVETTDLSFSLLPIDATKTEGDEQVPLTAEERRQYLREQVVEYIVSRIKRIQAEAADLSPALAKLAGFRYPPL